MDMNEEVENAIHQARMMSLQGDYFESLQKYNEIMKNMSERMDSIPPENREAAQRQFNRIVEESHATQTAWVRNQAQPSQPTISVNVPLNQSPTEEQTQQTQMPPYGPMFEDLSRTFMSIGRSVREFDEKYKITETCGQVASDIANKTVEMVNRPEVQDRVVSIGSTIRKWDEDNHVSEHIGNAFSTVATTTEHVFDRIFPSMGFTHPPATTQPQPDQPIEVNQPLSEEVYNSLPIASVVEETVPEDVTASVAPSTQSLHNEVD